MKFQIAFFSLLFVGVACSSSTPPPPDDPTGSCTLLASQCHGIKTPLGVECHDLGHDGDDAKCGPRKAECLAACPDDAHDGGHDTPPADDGGTQADAPSDAPGEAAADPCTSYCGCMKSTCSGEEGYPFADDAACLVACKAFSTEDRTCFSKHCETAKTGAVKKHDCDHANGTVACH